MENMTAERSLEIITKSIEQSRRDIERGSWKSMCLWGTAVTVIALIVSYLWANTSMGPAANMVWIVMALFAIVEIYAESKQPRKPRTFLSKIINDVWSSMGIMAGSLGLVCGLLAAFMAHTQPVSGTVILIPITPTIILIMSLAGMITGRVLRSAPITVCCFISGLAGSLLALIFSGPTEMVVLAGCSVVGLIVPALIIKSKEEE